MRSFARLLSCVVVPLFACGCESSTVAGSLKAPDVPCSLVLPRAINLGLVPAGVPIGAAVAVENLRSDQACPVVDSRVESCDEGFRFESLGPFAAAAGATTELPFTLEADAGAVSCTLVLETEHDLRTVPIRATVDACLEIPAALHFDGTAVGCPATRTLVVVNRCDPSLAVETIEVTDGPFEVAETSASIARGDDLAVEVRFRPTASGAAEGRLVVHLAGGGAVEVRLDGAGRGELPEDVFHQNARPLVDFLFVIENSTSMAGKLAHVATNLRGFPRYAERQEVDFRIGVTTTGLAPGGECPGGVGGGEDGRLVPVDGSRARWITREDDWETPWEANLAVGACREGPSIALEAALRALSPPVSDHADDPRHDEPADGNAGFLRPEAALRVIVVTDRADESPATVDTYVNALRALKPGQEVQVSAFTGDPERGCAGAVTAAPGDRLHRAAVSTGGIFLSFCDADWEWALREAALTSFGFQTCFFPTREPVDADGDGDLDSEDFQVWVDGVATPPERGGDRVWLFSDQLDGICFVPLAVPPPGSEIRLRYASGCE